MKITRILRVDLDGDGEEEVLINATNYFTEDNDVPMDTPAPGSHSVVLLRRMVAGKVQTEFVAGQVFPEDESSASNLYEIPAVFDLTGNTASSKRPLTYMITKARYTIYDCSGGKCEAALSVGCGLRR